MFRTLASRLTAYYVLAAIGIALIVGVALTSAVFVLLTRGAEEAVQSASRQVPELVKLYAADHKTLIQMAPDLGRHFEHTNVRVAVFETPNYSVQRKKQGEGYILEAKPIDPKNAVIMRGVAPAGPDKALPDMRVSVLGRHNPRPLYESHDRDGPRFDPLSAFVRVPPARVAVPGGVVVIFPDINAYRNRLVGYWLIALGAAVLVAALALLFGRSITRQALTPLHDVTTALEHLSQGDFTPRPVQTADRSELGQLARAYNAAVNQVTHAFGERDKAESQMRQFVADAGHELRTPLTVVMGFIDVLKRGASNDPALTARIFETMGQESRRMRALIDKLIVLARLEQPEMHAPNVFDVTALAKRVVDTFLPLDRQKRLSFVAQAQAYVAADEHELHEAIANLVDNALKYAPGAPVHVTVAANNGTIEIAVSDQGPGISVDDQAHAFDRFYRGSSHGAVEGSGLGLAIVKRAVERAEGHVELESQPGHGTRVTLRLPKAAEASATETAPRRGV